MSSTVEIENTVNNLNAEVVDNDVHLQLQELLSKVNALEKEKKEIHDNFNAQRAKLQKLYLQKEAELKGATSEHVRLEGEVEKLTKELDEAKSQLYIAGILKENEVEAEKRKAQAEIATLNQIVQDTVEVSSTSQTEVKRLKAIIHSLELQINKFRTDKDKEGLLLAPSNMLSGAKTLARKVVSQLGNDPDLRSQDNLEDSMKKAQEDAEVLKSLVIPLERKIDDLSTKLRIAEDKLKKYEPDENIENLESNNDIINKTKRSEKYLIDLSNNTSQESGGSHSPKGSEMKSPMMESLTGEIAELSNVASPSTTTMMGISPSKSVSCDMCVNYEAQLVAQQQFTKQLQKQKEQLENNLERFKEDFNKETQFRKDMEDKWNEKKEEHRMQVAELKKMYEGAEHELKSLENTFSQVYEEIKKQLESLKFDREKTNAQLEELQKENDNLIGKHSKHSEQLRNESINFPDTVEELQELLLNAHEELIAAKVAKEAKEEQLNTLKCEIQLLRDSMNSELSSGKEMENALTAENSSLRNTLSTLEKEKLKLLTMVERLSLSDKEHKEQAKSFREQLEDLLEEKKRCEDNAAELRSRVASLQQELNNSVAVQMDFVKLSQTLQIELEKIRGADTEVRWQHEEDVDDCPGCKNPFSSSRKRVHCRHCGQIFCPSCLPHTVYSGPHKRQSKVCQVCHTLLNRETAPYFSQKPPHSPD